MKKILIYCLLFSSLTLPITAAIKDVSKADGAYKAIEKTVNTGYLSLFNDKTFRPKETVTRKEMALILSKLLTEVSESKLSLSEAELSDLTELSKNFKASLADIETSQTKLEYSSDLVSSEQKNINHDMTKLNNDLQTELVTIKKQRTYMWAGIGIGSLLGILL